MSGESRPDYLEPYERAVTRHGPSFEATLWRSPSMQLTRFEVFQSMVDLSGSRVLDAGCGLGDFAAFLIDRGVEFARYIGIDGVAPVIGKARERQLPRAEFYVRDFVAGADDALTIGAPDVICFSGSLNTVPEPRARQVVARAFEIAGRSVLFNFLSDQCPESLRRENTGPATRFHTLDWLAWALKTTPGVAFRQDYFNGHDATIGMMKV